MYCLCSMPENRQFGPVGPLGPVGGIGITGPGPVGKIGNPHDINVDIQRIDEMLKRHMTVAESILTIVRENTYFLAMIQTLNITGQGNNYENYKN